MNISQVDFLRFSLFCFKYFLKVMVSRVGGTCFRRNLVMAMFLLGLRTSCWTMRAAVDQVSVEMESIVEATGTIEGPLGREIGRYLIHGKQATALIHLGGQLIIIVRGRLTCSHKRLPLMVSLQT